MITDKRILIADEDSVVLSVFANTLRGLGQTHEIVTAENGLEALDELIRKPFDLVITGLKMPRINGVQLTEAIKNLDPGTSVIWITAYGSYNFSDEAKRLGVLCCCDKPLEIWKLRQLARDALYAVRQ